MYQMCIINTMLQSSYFFTATGQIIKFWVGGSEKETHLYCSRVKILSYCAFHLTLL